MFTGIIETVGEIAEVKSERSNRTFKIKSSISSELRVDQSVAHDGVCLTVIKRDQDFHYVTAIAETLSKSNLTNWMTGHHVNLERCMLSNGRFDGHIVQGHVDTVAKLLSVVAQDGSWLFTFGLESTRLIVEKGSICINGTSLTCFDVEDDKFSVAIIPYTYEHTTFSNLKEGDFANIEFDIVGKYVAKLLKG